VLHVFQWQGLNRKGKKISGELSAASSLEAKGQLRKQGVTPGKIKKKSQPLFGLGGDKKITPAHIAVVTRQIATMLTAGVPLVQTIEMIGQSDSNGNMQRLLGDISNKLQTGIPLSECLRDHSQYFDDLYCDLFSQVNSQGHLKLFMNA
jgi:type IV pilus assembly protein PilC